ncbi:MAG: hypothetical protein N5P05_000492 [Chroococcopsis gigantea SAG 12.99]|jgi:hypothetical protein|nr:hypothetical protein [Chlorogloea purpurea SAG 13.99]MDV2998886.1 hypothetical protein [Chroococcopsis gigantea SAG 12.99]
MLYHSKSDTSIGVIRGEVDGNNYEVRVIEGHKRETDNSIFLIMYCQSFSNLKDFKDDSFKGNDFKCVYEIHKGQWTKNTWNKETKKFDQSEEKQSLLDKLLVASLENISEAFKGTLSLSDNASQLNFILETKRFDVLANITATEQSHITDDEIAKCMDTITKAKTYNNKGYAKKSILEVSQERLVAIKTLIPNYAGTATDLEGLIAGLQILETEYKDNPKVFDTVIDLLKALIA